MVDDRMGFTETRNGRVAVLVVVLQREDMVGRERPSRCSFVHFNDLKSDLAGEMRRIAEFLEEPIEDEKLFKKLVEQCTFDYMKKERGCGGAVRRRLWERWR